MYAVVTGYSDGSLMVIPYRNRRNENLKVFGERAVSRGVSSEDSLPIGCIVLIHGDRLINHANRIRSGKVY